jgi:hypothetical protein
MEEINYAVWVVMIGFLVMGVGSILMPVTVTSQFGINELTTAGRNEVRAVYGGFGILMGVVLYVSTVNPDWQDGILVAVAAALGGLAFGRVLSALMDRGIDKWPLFYLALEVVFAVFLLKQI